MGKTESPSDAHWADKIATELIKENPGKKKFVLASGITPSGTVHIGNFRDIITSDLVARALKDKGYNAEMIFSWDDYDRLRKIPSNIEKSYEKYLGMPISDIPDPYGCHDSYARHFEAELEKALPELGIKLRFIRQSEMYKQNKYYEQIKKALQNKEKIAEVLAKFKTQGMSEDEKGEFSPLQIYCRKCNNSMATKMIDYDGEDKVTYSCKCGNKETVDISKNNIGKLVWKIDWPMRWGFEGVNFEPGGWDHSSPGGSFDTAKEVAKILKIHPPKYQGYAFVGIEGVAKMSSSKGTGITPDFLLKIYEPELLRWLFSRAKPEKALTLFFDSDLIRQYNEFDEQISKYYKKELTPEENREIEFASVKRGEIPKESKVSFRQVASFGQIVQGNFQELKKMYERIGEDYDKNVLKTRYEKSVNWIEEFMSELKIELVKEPNKKYYKSLLKEEQSQINQLVKKINGVKDIESLTTIVYSIPKKPEFSEEEKKTAQRTFFKNVYNLLIGKETGPRLPTLLLALGTKKVKELLNFN